jgi:hypothetical protein
MLIEDSNGRITHVKTSPEATLEDALEIARESMNPDRTWVSVESDEDTVYVLATRHVVRVIIVGVPEDRPESGAEPLRGAPGYQFMGEGVPEAQRGSEGER